MQAPPRPPFRCACSGQACRLSHGSCFKTVSAPSFPCPPKSERCHNPPPENVARPCRRAVLRADAFRVRKTSPKPGGTPISIAVLRRKTSRRQAPASPANRRVRLRPARTLPAERRASAAPVPEEGSGSRSSKRADFRTSRIFKAVRTTRKTGGLFSPIRACYLLAP